MKTAAYPAKNIYIAFSVCLALLLAGCGQDAQEPIDSSGASVSISIESNAIPEDISIDYGTSAQFTQQDMDSAIETIKHEFATWDGCVLHSLAFYGDAAGSDYLEGYNTWGNPTYQECIVFDSTFHSPVDAESASEHAFNEDWEYTGWQWYLMRDSSSDPWTLITWGEG